jgi:Flagellar protein YcgR
MPAVIASCSLGADLCETIESMENDILSVGLPLYLQVIKMKYGERYPTTLIGWERDSFIIAKHPYSGRRPLQIYEE